NWYFASLLIVIYVLLFVSFEPKEQAMNGSVIIIEVDEMDSYYKYTIYNGQNKYHYSSNIVYNVGNTLSIKGDIEVYRKATIPGGFSSYNYYLGKDIKGIFRGTVSLINSDLNFD